MGPAFYITLFIFKSVVFVYRLSERLGLPDVGAEVLSRYIRTDGLEQG